MEVVPAIDVSGGQVVRLERGDLSRRTVYGDDPAAAARRWTGIGATRLHVVDIDGAFEGGSRNREAILAVIVAAGVPVQVAGGIRDAASVRTWRDAGADRVVVGTIAILDEAFDVDDDALVVAADVDGRAVRVRGWTQDAGLDIADAARRLASRGARRLLVTDVSRDGLLAGPNVALYEELAEIGVPVIASGGVSSIDDLRALAAVRGVEAVVVGKALYAGTIELEEAIAACSPSA